jgi:hypothetical protein
VGALANLGYAISDQTVGNILQRHALPPAPERKHTTTWPAFIRTHLALLAGTDFFTAEVLTLRGLVTYYVLFFIHLEPPGRHRRHHRSPGRALDFLGPTTPCPRWIACGPSPRHPYESECDDQDHHGCEKEVCPRSPLAPRRLLSKMAGVYSHDENPVPLEEDRAKAPVIQAPWEAFSSPQAASQGPAKHGAKCGATRNDRERRDGLLDVAAVLHVIACSEALSRKLPPRRAAHVPQTWKVFNCKPPPSQPWTSISWVIPASP